MTRRVLISSAEAVQGKCQHTEPCSDCPWRRDSLNGWLGGATPEDWIKEAHGDLPTPCHTITNMQCPGLAIYRANVCKSPKHPEALRLSKDTEKVFAWHTEFLEHHKASPAKFLGASKE